MGTAQKIDRKPNSPDHATGADLKQPVLLEAVASNGPATLIPSTGNYRKIEAKRGFAKNFFIMSFLGSSAGFFSGMLLTILILQGKVDVNKDAIKAFLRSLSGH